MNLKSIRKHSKSIVIAEVMILVIGTIIAFADTSPDTPANLKVIDNSDCVNELIWEPSEQANVYRVYRSQDDKNYKFIGTTTDTHFTDETSNNDYSYKVSACRGIKKSNTSDKSKISSIDNTNTVSDILTQEDAIEFIRNSLKQRKNEISLDVYSDTDISKELFLAAISHTGVPDEGDYIKFQFNRWNADTEQYDGVESINYHIDYYSTAEQEESVKEKSSEIIQSLNLEGKSDYEKIKSIYKYLRNNITYDQNQYSDNNIKRTSYSALVKGKTICQGYSLAFYRLLLEAGIDNRIVYGTYKPQIGPIALHTWNLVQCDGKYYYIDITNDDNSDSNFVLHSSEEFNETYKPKDFDTESYTISNKNIGTSFNSSMLVMRILKKLE